jgi:protein-disulfide isomerase
MSSVDHWAKASGESESKRTKLMNQSHLPRLAFERLAIPVNFADHIRGPVLAPVTLLEYGDYECPACGAAHQVVAELRKRLGRRLRFVFRNFPLIRIHPRSESAAQAAEAAGVEAKFWEMHDILYWNQHALEDQHLAQYATSLGLDGGHVVAEIWAGKYSRRLREDFRSGLNSGVNGTPTFFINGLRHDGDFQFGELSAALEHASRI